MHTTARRLLLAAVGSLWLALPARADESARAAVHEALSAELPVTRTETALPGSSDRSAPGPGNHNGGDQKRDRPRDERREPGDREHRDGKDDGQKDHEGRGHEGRDEHEGGRNEGGEHGHGGAAELGDIGEHGSGERTVDGENGEHGEHGRGGGDNEKGGRHDGPD